MAVVYLAEQIGLKRQVALKVLSPELGEDAEFRERFRREGENVAALEHPNIIPVFVSGEDDGRLYLAMPFMRGGTLAARIKAGGLGAVEALTILRPVADALDTAHAANVVHRDVKPQNILLDGSGHPYLADFGVAKGLNVAGLTTVGRFVGTYNYAAPEQIIGQEITPAVDVYAFTAVLFECFTGQVPYPRETEGGVVHAHMSEPPPTAAGTQPATAAFNRLTAQGMAKAPEDRYQHAGDVTRAAMDVVAQMTEEQRLAAPAFSQALGSDRADAVGGAASSHRNTPPIANDATVIRPDDDRSEPREAGINRTNQPAQPNPRPPQDEPTNETTADRRRTPKTPEDPPPHRSPNRRVLAAASLSVVLVVAMVIGAVILTSGGPTSQSRTTPSAANPAPSSSSTRRESASRMSAAGYLALRAYIALDNSELNLDASAGGQRLTAGCPRLGTDPADREVQAVRSSCNAQALVYEAAAEFDRCKGAPVGSEQGRTCEPNYFVMSTRGWNQYLAAIGEITDQLTPGPCRSFIDESVPQVRQVVETSTAFLTALLTNASDAVAKAGAYKAASADLAHLGEEETPAKQNRDELACRPQGVTEASLSATATTPAPAIKKTALVPAPEGSEPGSSPPPPPVPAPQESVATVDGYPISGALIAHWMYVAAKSNAATTAGTPVIVPTDPPGFSDCLKQVRAEIPSLAKTSDTKIVIDCKQLFTSLVSQVMDYLIKSYWYQLDALKLNIMPTSSDINQAYLQGVKQQKLTGAAMTKFLGQTGQTLADVRWRVLINLIYKRLIAREQTHEPPVNAGAVQRYYADHPSEFRASGGSIESLVKATPAIEKLLNSQNESHAESSLDAQVKSAYGTETLCATHYSVNDCAGYRTSALPAALSKEPVVTVPPAPAPNHLQTIDLIKGTGQVANAGSDLTVNYVGELYSNHKVFDSSWQRHKYFGPFKLGAGLVIKGWDEGLVGMRVGGRRELIVPPALAYGSAGSPPVIPPNATLVYVVDLISIS